MRLIILGIIISISIFFFFNENVYCADWRPLAENEMGEFLYDATSISSTGEGMIAVDWKTILSINAAKAAEEVTPHLKGVSFVLYHDTINCDKMVYEITTIQYYNVNGKLITSSRADESKYKPIGFRPIPPDTVIGYLADNVCK